MTVKISVFTPTLDGPVLRIGIYRTSSIGDMVLATACLNALGKLPIRAQIYWIGRNPTLDLIHASYPQIETVEISDTTPASDLERILQPLKKLHCLIDLQRSVRSRLFGRRLAKCGVRVYGMHKSQIERNRLILAAKLRGRTRPLPEEVAQASRFQYEMMLEPLERALRDFLPVEILDQLLSSKPIPLLPEPAGLHIDSQQKPWQRELSFGDWFALAPGAAHETKRAGEDLFRKILEDIHLLFPETNLVILGNDQDRAVGLRIIDRLKWSGRILNLAGKLTLLDSANVLRSCRGILSNDSSLAHIAEAVEVPAFVLFGPTVERFGFAPRLLQSKAFSSLIGCRPCSKHGKNVCRYGDKMCFLNISHITVADEINKHLTKTMHKGGELRVSALESQRSDHEPLHL